MEKGQRKRIGMQERGGSQGRKHRRGDKVERKNQPGQGDSEQEHKKE